MSFVYALALGIAGVAAGRWLLGTSTVRRLRLRKDRLRCIVRYVPDDRGPS